MCTISFISVSLSGSCVTLIHSQFFLTNSSLCIFEKKYTFDFHSIPPQNKNERETTQTCANARKRPEHELVVKK